MDVVIDCHTHIAWRPLYDARFFAGLSRPLLSKLEGSAGPAARARAERLMGNLFRDQWCDTLVEQMDLAGIERAVLLIVPTTNDIEHQRMTIEEIYTHHRAVLQRHPHRLIVFAGVDPRSGESGLRLFRESVRDWGFRGMKLYPPLGYRVDSEMLWSYYALCRDYELPVVIHTGPSLPGLESSLAAASRIANVTRKWPEVRFILAHAGYRLDADAILLAGASTNIYLDMSAFQSRYARVGAHAADELGRVFSDSLVDKVLFGTDWPLFNLFTPPSRNVQFLRELFQMTRFRDDGTRLERVLAGNARQVLGLAGKDG